MTETNFQRTRRFHQVMGLTVRDVPGEPSEAERLLRAKLLFEETLETITKGLGIAMTFDVGDQTYCIEPDDEGNQIDFEIAGSYDPVETLDGLADVKVIANGTAVQFGLPMEEGDLEVFESNMSKLDENGNPIVNRCKYPIGEGAETQDCLNQLHHGECVDTDHLIDPTKPIGKLLKSPQFRPADIGRVIREAHEKAMRA